ncbi:uncharacterized protein LOC133806453 [Humulus lupulus]|uniref:uncharacterized protein LOC133806453 n=1 Tax=Humulus lupulus TaxID=3486 RepID=UPI002B4059F5|nr:uncharacterized protein LOC133806453 [Humulus lupulus]
MPSGEAFDLYADDDAPLSKKRASRRHPGEGSSDPARKKARAEDPPTPHVAPTPSMNMTPLPPPRNNLPPEQARKPSTNDLLSVANATQERIQRLSWVSSQWGMATAELRRKAKFAEEVKAVEARYAEKLKAAEEKSAKLGEELKNHQEALVKITEAKEKYKEASALNFKEASKLQDDLVISRKETDEQEERANWLEEANARNLEKYKGAAFKCFYLFWKSNPRDNFDYLPEHMKQAELAKCAARLEEEKKVQESPEISLATNIEGAEEDAETTID